MLLNKCSYGLKDKESIYRWGALGNRRPWKRCRGSVFRPIPSEADTDRSTGPIWRIFYFFLVLHERYSCSLGISFFACFNHSHIVQKALSEVCKSRGIWTGFHQSIWLIITISIVLDKARLNWKQENSCQWVVPGGKRLNNGWEEHECGYKTGSGWHLFRQTV